MMDLGATLCTRGTPECGRCPLSDDCQARQTDRQRDLPSPRPRKALPVRRARLLLLYNDRHEVLLERRPPSGIWGGLWSLPEVADDAAVADWCRERLGVPAEVTGEWPMVQHTFSHFRFDMQPVLAQAAGAAANVMDAAGWLWYKPDTGEERGLAAPVAQLLQRFNEHGTRGET
jgi:A/G-specific adenine glycosylase